MRYGVGGMIISPFTSPLAQKSYDRARENPSGLEGRAGGIHFGIQMGNLLAHISMPLALTRMSNPHLMSYAYEGLDAAKFGTAAALRSRKEFQIASSRAFRMGETVGGYVMKGTKYAGRGARFGGRVAVKAVPGLGWSMLAYDVYDLAANRRLFGIQL